MYCAALIDRLIERIGFKLLKNVWRRLNFINTYLIYNYLIYNYLIFLSWQLAPRWHFERREQFASLGVLLIIFNGNFPGIGR